MKSDIHDMKPDRSQRLMAFGVRPMYPSVFWDCDSPGIGRREAYARLERYVMTRCRDRQWALYLTKNGYHLIVRCDSWDEAQERLYELKQTVGGLSIMNCRKQRIRISPKIKELGGDEVSPAPVLIHTNSRKDLREGAKEIYYTYDVGLDTNSEELLK